MKKILRWTVFMLGFVVGFQLFLMFSSLGSEPLNLFGYSIKGPIRYIFGGGAGILSGFILFILFPSFARILANMSSDWIKRLRRLSLMQIAVNVGGLIIALILAWLISSPVLALEIPAWISTILVFAIYAGLGYLGLFVCNTKYADIEQLFKNAGKGREREPDEVSPANTRTKSSKKHTAIPKVLDTSVIIDGRIFDILRTGFLEGPVVIANFVLDELQLIADSADALKRNRGRRGLDVLNKIQKELSIEIILTDKNYPDISEVDSKLLKLALDMKGKIVTNDYNLNKIAELQGLEVLNTNDLSNAVKSVVLPGEEMSVQVIKEGKEHNQGVAYLDDGTMIVIEDGRSLINKSIHVVVTSVLQTSAGRMIFAKPISIHT